MCTGSDSDAAADAEEEGDELVGLDVDMVWAFKKRAKQLAGEVCTDHKGPAERPLPVSYTRLGNS